MWHCFIHKITIEPAIYNIHFTSSAFFSNDGIPYKCCISTILKNITVSTFDLPLSLQYNSSTKSYVCIKSTALSIFLIKAAKILHKKSVKIQMIFQV